MAKKSRDRVDILEEEIKKYKTIIRNKDKTIRKLKSDLKTVEDSWRQTEIYLKEVTDGKPLSEVLETVESEKPLSKINDTCPNCKGNNMKKILFTGFHIISCECGYRKKVDEEQKIRKSQSN